MAPIGKAPRQQQRRDEDRIPGFVSRSSPGTSASRAYVIARRPGPTSSTSSTTTPGSAPIPLPLLPRQQQAPPTGGSPSARSLTQDELAAVIGSVVGAFVLVVILWCYCCSGLAPASRGRRAPPPRRRRRRGGGSAATSTASDDDYSDSDSSEGDSGPRRQGWWRRGEPPPTRQQAAAMAAAVAQAQAREHAARLHAQAAETIRMHQPPVRFPPTAVQQGYTASGRPQFGGTTRYP